MKAPWLLFLVLCSFALLVSADHYLHVPRGSNNRLNEQSANRNNGNRLFDSQNNNRGGYNVGDAGAAAAQSQDEQHRMPFFERSILSVEWTNQHACGSNRKVRCEHILQYMCRDDLRDGTTTNTPPENADDTSTGLHEPRAYYAECRDNIARNEGLWTADQNLNGDTAIYTRQNPNGNRRGYECPEERDYYPWWHENPWKDVAILTSEPEERCEWYKQALASLGRPSNVPCQMAAWSRDNHLGNTLDGYMASYNWTMPTTEEACGKTGEACTCVFRMRYNISTTDVDWFINSTFNDEASPLQQNPTVDIGVMQGFRLAINTAQTGRTFQDRSHVFTIEPRPAGVSNNDKIYNVIVRGKRGNIVQTFPAVEYDFHPNRLTVSQSDWVQIQWTGSNTHNNGNPAGDGQAGDDGQGTGGTDRSNVVEIEDLNVNYPTPTPHTTMWNVLSSIPPTTPEELIIAFASSGAGVDVQELLNDAPASFVGPLLRFRAGTYHYMCTRNNNFSNRSQKGTLFVTN